MELSEDDIGCIHDAICDANGFSYDDDYIRCTVHPPLPQSVKLTAAEWGWCDTEVREAIYKLFETN